MFRSANQPSGQTVSIELRHDRLGLVICRRQNDETLVETCVLPWRQEANLLHSTLGREELTAALRELASRYRLQSADVNFALHGDLCVTRVAAGTAEHVRKELAQLEERSALYLTLGHGRKALGANIRQIDAKRWHALLSVVNQKTLDALIIAAGRAGLTPSRVEPSLVSLCRLVGRMGDDAQNPVLVVSLGHLGAEVGISLGGQLLLDYRPASQESWEQVAHTILGHLNRLQRYCDRYVRLGDGPLKKIYLCGDPAAVEAVESVLAQQERLQPRAIDAVQAEPTWRFTDGPPASDLGAALGACMAGAGLEGPTGPNFMERVQAQSRKPMGRELVKLCWPIAATLLLASCLWGYNFVQRGRVNRLEEKLAHFEAEQRQAALVRGQVMQRQQQIEHLRAIDAHLAGGDWGTISRNIAGCLPDDVWLDSLALEPGGGVKLIGASYNEEGVFELIRALRGYPALDRIALSHTRAARLPFGPATQFELTCRSTDLAGKKESNDESK